MDNYDPRNCAEDETSCRNCGDSLVTGVMLASRVRDVGCWVLCCTNISGVESLICAVYHHEADITTQNAT